MTIDSKIDPIKETKLRSQLGFWLFVFPLLVLFFLELTLQLLSVMVSSNEHDFQRNWNTDNIRVLAVGDSNTYGLFVEEQESWPLQLQQLWNTKHTVPQLEVINIGYPGMNTWRVLDSFEGVLDTFQPDIVLLMIGANDYLNPYQGEDKIQKKIGVQAWLKQHSRSWRLLNMLIRDQHHAASLDMGERLVYEPTGNREERAGVMLEWKINRQEAGQGEVIRYGDTEFVFNKLLIGQKANQDNIQISENIGVLSTMAKAKNTPVILLSYPASQRFYKHANVFVRESAELFDLPLIDIATELKKFCPITKECPQWFFAPHDLHPRAEGYAVSAEFIAKQLEDLLVE